MESDEVTWKLVPNTVAERMIDLSLIHKLVPCRRLSRRNKVTNVALKECNLKTYNQYIRVKTSVLRNCSDDSEIDDNVSFTEDDYAILYKSDASLKEYLSDTHRNYSFVTEFENDEDDAAFDTESQDTFTQLPERSPSRIADTGKKKSEDKGIEPASSSTPNTATSTGSLPRLDAAASSKRDARSTAQSSFHKNTSTVENEVSSDHSTPVTGKMGKTSASLARPFHRFENFNETRHEQIRNSPNGSSRAPEARRQTEPETETETETESKIRERLRLKKSGETDTRKGRKKHPTASSDSAKAVQNRDDSPSFPSAAVPSVRRGGDFRNEHSSAGSAGVNERKTCKYQPKDSGIEEDTEEEVQVLRKHSYSKEFEREGSPLLGSSASHHKSPSTIFPVDLDFERPDSPIQSNAAIPDHQDANSGKKEYTEKSRKRKAQPKITCTEIVKKKYKIICDASVANELSDPENFSPAVSVVSKSRAIREIRETEEAEQHAEDISPWSKRRLQQLRRLNLTMDSDSSDNEKDDSCCPVRNTRDEPIDQAVNHSAGSSTEDQSENHKPQFSVRLNARSRNRKDGASKRSAKVNVEASHRRTSPRLTSSTSGNVRTQENASDENPAHVGDIATADTTERSNATATATATDRPRNLEEFARMESLANEAAPPSFKFEDIQEDELFFIDIPSVLVQAQLKGKTIVLKKEKMRIGKQKYRVKWMDVDAVSCVFASGNPAKPCKAVNLKPKAKIATRERILLPSTVNR